MNKEPNDTGAMKILLEELADQLKKMNDKAPIGLGSLSQEEINKLYTDLQKVPNSVARLPLPKRLEVPEIAGLRSAALGRLATVIDALVETNSTSNEIYEAIVRAGHLEAIREAGVSKVVLETQIIASRFIQRKAPVFTLRSSLGLRLDDLDTGPDVPVNLLRTPFDCCYIEFCPSENRDLCNKFIHGEGGNSIVEGAYCTSYSGISIKHMKQSTLEALKLDRNKPARVIEICFTGSPIPPKNSNKSVLSITYDMCELVTLVIQDENETLNEAIDRHIDYKLSQQQEHEFDKNEETNISESFKLSITTNLYHLIKALIYINSDMKVEVIQKDHSEMIQRLKNIKSPKKFLKLTQQMKRTYDRVLLGPDQKYTPLSETLDQIARITGIRPHVRRAYFGIRWTGVGRLKAKSTWIRPAFVNANSNEDIEHLIKDYLIF